MMFAGQVAGRGDANEGVMVRLGIGSATHRQLRDSEAVVGSAELLVMDLDEPVVVILEEA